MRGGLVVVVCDAASGFKEIHLIHVYQCLVFVFLTSRIPENKCFIEIHADKENTQSISGYRSSPQSF